MRSLSPCLWFDKNGEEAARFYVSLLPNSRIDHVQRAPADNPSSKKGEVLVVDFTLMGNKYQALNGGPNFKFTEAISLSVTCDTQEEVDRLWAALTADGGKEVACGWLKDKYGLSWQIVPARMFELLASPDAGVSKRAFEAMMTMVKLDIAAIERAAKG
ncbi:MAG TPA: VOC family protein [Hyphomicrobiaceae bacterium]|nr:VOC family protein [Hyphomicrobiaceae bacterium]